MKYLVSLSARGDLLSIWRYSADRWDEEQADLYVDAIVVRFAWLTRNPGLWPWREELGADLCSYPERSHVIFCRRRRPHLQILRVLHAAMDPSQVSE